MTPLPHDHATDPKLSATPPLVEPRESGGASPTPLVSTGIAFGIFLDGLTELASTKCQPVVSKSGFGVRMNRQDQGFDSETCHPILLTISSAAVWAARPLRSCPTMWRQCQPVLILKRRIRECCCRPTPLGRRTRYPRLASLVALHWSTRCAAHAGEFGVIAGKGVSNIIPLLEKIAAETAIPLEARETRLRSQRYRARCRRRRFLWRRSVARCLGARLVRTGSRG